MLEGKLGKKLAASASYRNFCRTKRLELCEACGRWGEVGRLAREEVEAQPDQWQAYRTYLGAVSKLRGQGERLKENKENGEVEQELTREAALTLIKQQQSQHPSLRGPWLAELELLATLGDPESSSPRLIRDYFEKFGGKHVAYSDLRPYLARLEQEQQEELVTSLEADYSSQPTSQAEIYRDVNLRATRRFSGGHGLLSLAAAEAEVSALVTRWRAVQPLVADLLPTDLRPSDNYLVLAGHLLWDLWQVLPQLLIPVCSLHMANLGLRKRVNYNLLNLRQKCAFLCKV